MHEAELRVMGNESYARRGKTFPSGDLQNDFSERSQDRQNPSYSHRLPSQVYKENVKIIQNFETSMQ